MTKLSWVKVYSLKRLRNIKSITLVELIISLVIVSILVLSFYSFETYSHNQVLYLNRRSKVQNDLNYTLEHMSKYVQKANGSLSNPGIELLSGSGFRVRVDFSAPQTPENPNDAWISYILTGNTLSTSCAVIGGGSCGSFLDETLATRIITGFSNTAMPVPVPGNPSGFYVRIDPSMTNIVEVGLVGRYNPALAAQITTNPQVVMKSKLICNSCSTN